jgi:hypothetical protein
VSSRIAGRRRAGSVGENWVDQAARLDGTAGYVIVDDGGVLEISEQYWAGARLPLESDEQRMTPSPPRTASSSALSKGGVVVVQR